MKKRRSIAFLHCREVKKLLLIMRLTTIFLIVGLMQVSASVYSQATKFEFNIENKQIADILKEIEESSNFRFFYVREQVDVERTVSVDVNDATVEEILTEIFEDEGVSYKVMDDDLIVLSPEATSVETNVKLNNVTQQQNTVTGAIVDDNGEPLPGVTVMVKGTTNGTITDFDGNYSISGVPSDAILSFSFVGMISQEISVAGKNSISVTMEEETIGLDEVVAIGYGVQRKSDLTGSISQVKAADLENRSITSINTGIQGKTAGVQVVTTSGAPGASTSIRVRGISSNSASTPLYVVDGLRTTSIDYIDPSDIESMEILKDAASAAIYGAEAGNGVVLITTKKASQGTLRIDYDMQYSIQQISNMPQALNAEEYIQYLVTEGNLVAQDRITQFYDGYTDTKWADVAFENGSMQRHNVSFQGANDKGSVYSSLSYLSNDGPVIGNQDKNKRMTGTVNADYKIKPWLKFSSNNSFATSSTTSVPAGGMSSLPASVIQMDPLTPVIYSQDNLPTTMQSLLDQGHAFLQDDNGNYYSMSPFQESNNINPYILRDANRSLSETFNLRGSTNIDITPWKTVVFTSRLGYDVTSSTNYSVTWPHTQNTDTNIDYVTIRASDNDNKYYQLENFVNYMESFDKHNVNVMGGMSYSERNTFGVTGSISGTNANNIGITKLDRNYAYFANQTGTATKTISGGEKRTYAQLSYFGRISYNYDNKYFLQGSYRADAADLSILPLNSRWGYFPAVSAGWTVSNEDFFKNLDMGGISNFKIRASWGQNGSTAALGNYMYASTITSDVMYPFTRFNYQVGSRPSATGNYNLKWETSEQLDFGLDLRMLKDRLAFSMDWYKKETKDLLMTGVSSSAVVGNTLSPLNAGNVVNKGFEFDLSWKDNIGKDFSYGISANLSTLKNEVTDIYSTLTRVAGASGGSGLTTYFEKGYPIWYMRGYKYLGVDNTNGNPIFEDKNNDGFITDADKQMIGSAIPDLTYGITLNLAYKGLDLIVFANGTYGNDIAWAVPRAVRIQANELKYFYDRRWTTPGVDAQYPAASRPDYSNYVQSSAMVFDGSYFKIKQIQLGYTVPKTLLNKTNVFNSVRVYVSFDDFFVFTKYPGFDPEVSMSSSGLGLDYGQYPSTKRATFGINISL